VAEQLRKEEVALIDAAHRKRVRAIMSY
jgi:hypothetical protein